MTSGTESFFGDPERLRKVAAEIRADAADLNEQRSNLSAWGGTTEGYTPVEWQDGVKVTLGTFPFEHSGRAAGRRLAAVIRGSGDLYVSVEDGLRALAGIIETIAHQLESQDDVNATSIQAASTAVTDTDTTVREETWGS